ncbi:MAG TPA: PAS domain-containing protein [Gemmatimonadaceae bacterium]|nr:PAS domain-containing protein [Gemmatimonadaceae bacterium]
MPGRFRSPLSSYVTAVVATAVAAALRVLLERELIQIGTYLPFIMAVVVAAWHGGLRPGLLASALSVFAIAASFRAEDPSGLTFATHGIGLLLFAAASGAVSWLCELLHRTNRRLEAERLSRHRADEFHRAIADLSSDFAFRGRISPDGTSRMDELTEGYKWLLHLSREELHDRGGWRGAIHPDDTPSARDVVARLLAGQTAEGTIRLVAGDGNVVWVRYRVRPAERAPDGTIIVHGAVVDITQLKRTEEARQQSEEQARARAEELEALISAVPAIVWVAHDREARRMTGSLYGHEWLQLPADANPSMTAPQSERPRHFRVLRDGVELRPHELPMQRAARGEPVHDFEEEVVFEDGRRRFLLGNAITLYDQEGAPRGAIGAFVDVTERKLAEEALAESEQRLRMSLDAGRMGVWSWDLGTGKVNWSESLEQMYGLAPGTFPGTIDAFRSLVHPDDRPVLAGAVERALTNRVPFDVEFRTVSPDGSVHWMAGKGSAIFGADGDPKQLIGVGLDVTDRRRAEETIRLLMRVSTKLNSTLNIDELLDILVQEAIEFAGAESGVAGLNTPAGMVSQRYFQRGREMPLEYRWPPGYGLAGWLLVHKRPYLTNDAASDPQCVRELCDQFGVTAALSTPIMNARGDVLGFFEIHNKKNGAGFTREDVVRLQALSQSAAVAIQNALAYRRLEEAERELKEADRRKDEFLATLAHELRNPLAPIRNAVELLAIQEGLPAPLRTARDVIERQVAQMVHLVDDLLDVSRVSRDRLQIRREVVELSTVVQHAIETSRPLIDTSGHVLTVDVPSEPVYLDADMTRLAQVVANLLNNAAKFTPDGGTISLRAVTGNGHVRISVRDAGIGIAREHLDRIFEMFSQVAPALQRAEGGLGIGLSLVRRLVELHGGQVEARSEGLGHGSEFIITLPVLAAPQPPSSVSVNGQEATTPVAQSRILVVDDNHDTAESLAQLLRLRGHDVRVAFTGIEAVEACERSTPDVVLLDIGLPGLNGYEAARRIRELPAGRRIQLVAITGWGQEEDRQRSRAAGFDHHLVKPVGLAAVEPLLRHEPEAAPETAGA